MWNNFSSLPNDKSSYLVSWRKEDGSFSEPHRAYWVEWEGRFFSSENGNDHPLAVDLYFEIPQIS